MKLKSYRCRGVAQPGSVLAWGASGRRFKSSRPDQQIKKSLKLELLQAFLSVVRQQSPNAKGLSTNSVASLQEVSLGKNDLDPQALALSVARQK